MVKKYMPSVVLFITVLYTILPTCTVLYTILFSFTLLCTKSFTVLLLSLLCCVQNPICHPFLYYVKIQTISHTSVHHIFIINNTQYHTTYYRLLSLQNKLLYHVIHHARHTRNNPPFYNIYYTT